MAWCADDTLCALGRYALLPATGKLWVYARSADAISEACLRKVFGKYESPEGKTLKVTVLGVLAEDAEEADEERPEVKLLMSVHFHLRVDLCVSIWP